MMLDPDSVRRFCSSLVNRMFVNFVRPGTCVGKQLYRSNCCYPTIASEAVGDTGFDANVEILQAFDLAENWAMGISSGCDLNEIDEHHGTSSTPFEPTLTMRTSELGALEVASKSGRSVLVKTKCPKWLVAREDTSPSFVSVRSLVATWAALLTAKLRQIQAHGGARDSYPGYPGVSPSLRSPPRLVWHL